MQKVPPFPHTPFPLQKLLSGRVTGSCPSARRPLPAGPPKEGCGGRCFSSFLIRSRAGGFGPAWRAGSPARRAAGDKGPGRPLTPYNPQPRLGTAIPCEDRVPSGAPCPPLCRASYGLRPPAVPRNARDERPGGVGAAAPPARRSPPRHDALTPSSGMTGCGQANVPALPHKREKNFPSMSHGTG